ncbi:MAG: nucleotide exchange factor GrpE, partial [Holosporaceae bacterium]|nr:nucleotide exchange factor GrpE [Holosporaceae bacterium]
ETVLRKAAELENIRKRTEKEKEEAIKYSNGKFAKDLLSIADNFERVMENSASIKDKTANDTSLKALLDGVLLCKKELLSIFKKHGIFQIEISDGATFDPQCHQAMCEVNSSDHDEGTIIQVLQMGYMHYDRLLRPAMVTVSKKA